MKDYKRVSRAIEYCRANNYPVTAVFNIIGEEGLKVRIKINSDAEDKSELLAKLQRYVETALAVSAPLPMVETYLYSYEAFFDIVDPDNPDESGSDVFVNLPQSSQESPSET